MARRRIYHALGFNLHQPRGNLRLLLDTAPVDAREVVLAYDRIARHAHKYAEAVRLHLAISGSLLTQLHDPDLVSAYEGVVSLPDLVDSLRSAPNVELVAGGLHRPYFPAVPPADRTRQIALEIRMVEEVFGRRPKGFLPPRDGFTPDMIPVLADLGIVYVALESGRMRRTDGSPIDPFRPQLVSQGKAQVIAVPIDGDLSSMQATGQSPAKLADEMCGRTVDGPEPRLVATFSDGENGDWYRREGDDDGFFGDFFCPYAEFCESGEYPARSAHLSELLTGPSVDAFRLEPAILADVPDVPVDSRFTEVGNRLQVVAGLGSRAEEAQDCLLAAEGDGADRDMWLSRVELLIADALADPQPDAAPAPETAEPAPKKAPPKKAAPKKAETKPAPKPSKAAPKPKSGKAAADTGDAKKPKTTPKAAKPKETATLPPAPKAETPRPTTTEKPLYILGWPTLAEPSTGSRTGIAKSKTARSAAKAAVLSDANVVPSQLLRPLSATSPSSALKPTRRLLYALSATKKIKTRSRSKPRGAA